MEIPEDRRWMYNRLDHQTRDLQSDFLWGVEKFLDVASQLDEFKYRGEIRCPCSRCKCMKYKPHNDVRNHLYRKGFQPYYYVWYSHGETTTNFFSGYNYGADPDPINNYEQRRPCEEVWKRDVHIPEIVLNLNFDEKTQKQLSPYADTVIGKLNTMKEYAISRGEEVDDSTLFPEACGGKNKRGKAFGMGHELCKYTKSSEGEEIDHLNKRLKLLESEVNIVHELVEENKQLKSEMAELRSLVRKLARNKSRDHSCGPSYVPSIYNDNRDGCDGDEVNCDDDDGRHDSDGCDDNDGTRVDGVKDNNCVGPGFSYDGSI